jgi:hypothetical protein
MFDTPDPDATAAAGDAAADPASALTACVAQVVAAAERVHAADLSVASVEVLKTVLVDVLAATDVLRLVHAQALHRFEDAKGHEADGCSSLATWTRNVLRFSTKEIHTAKRTAKALSLLDDVCAAADAGEIRPEHVETFGKGINKIDTDTIRDAQDPLLLIARRCDPRGLDEAIDLLHASIPDDPDGEDAAFQKACEREDVTITRSGNGYRVRGFVNAHRGTTWRTVLDALGRPLGKNELPDGVDTDERPVAQRRVEGLDRLFAAHLDAGTFPSDHGVRPHLQITTSLTELQRALGGDRSSGGEPARLIGHGFLGRDLLARIACDSAITMLLTDGHTTEHRCPETTTGAAGNQSDVNAHRPAPASTGVRHPCGCPVTPYVHVLDVGRTERLATPRQRAQVLQAQQYLCAMPGCNNRHLEVHHIDEWVADDGPTDIDNLVGLCVGCHTLTHRGLLVCAADGHGGQVFSTRHGDVIVDVRRQGLADYARRLHDLISAGLLDRIEDPDERRWRRRHARERLAWAQRREREHPRRPNGRYAQYRHELFAEDRPTHRWHTRPPE